MHLLEDEITHKYVYICEYNIFFSVKEPKKVIDCTFKSDVHGLDTLLNSSPLTLVPKCKGGLENLQDSKSMCKVHCHWNVFKACG